MRKNRTILFLFIIIVNLTFLSGCWDLREINEIGLVTAVGIDKADGTNRYSVTVQIANPSTDNASDSKGSAKSDVWIGTEQGTSLFDATRKLVEISSRRVMWAHNNVIVIGESMAKEGIIPIVDYFTHNPELRMKTAVVVAKGDAKDYIAARAGTESPSGVSFILLESYRAIIGESVESHMLQVSAALKNEYGNPLIAGIKLKKAIMQSNSAENKEESSKTIALSGAAVFKKDKMVGWLSPEESLGVSWVLNQTRNALVTVIDNEHGNKNVSVETEAVKAKVKTEVTNGMPRVSIHISGKGDIVEEDGSTSKDMNEVKENVAGLLDKKIEDEIRHSIDVIQKEYGIDVLGFAAIVHAHNDKEWEGGLKDKWQEIFPQIPVTVTVDINIKSSSLNQEPMKVY